MNESIQTVIRFKPQMTVISIAELNLLESLLPEVILAMQELQSNSATELITESAIATELETDCCK